MSYNNSNTSVAAAWNSIASKMKVDGMTFSTDEMVAFTMAGIEAIQDAKCARDVANKTCTKCGESKPRSEYYGKQPRCKPCFRSQVQARQHANAIPTVYAIVIDQRVVYVGSTFALSTTKRLEAHWSRANTGGTSRIAQALREAQRANQAVSIVVLEAMDGATKRALLKQEKVWIRRFSRLTNNSLCQVRSVPKV